MTYAEGEVLTEKTIQNTLYINTPYYVLAAEV